MILGLMTIRLGVSINLEYMLGLVGNKSMDKVVDNMLKCSVHGNIDCQWSWTTF